MLLDERLPPDVRAVAAVEAGKQAAPGSERALVAALRAGPPLVVRRAAESLDESADLRRCRRCASCDRTMRNRRSRGRCRSPAFDLYRFGLGSDLLKTPGAGEILTLDDPEPIQIQATPIGADAVERIAPRYRLEVPGVPLSPRGALQLRCGPNEFLIVPHEGIAALGERNAVVGVVLKRAQSLEYFALHLYLLSHPREEGTLSLFGVRPDGTLTHFGEMRLGAQEHAFRMNALNTPTDRRSISTGVSRPPHIASC